MTDIGDRLHSALTQVMEASGKRSVIDQALAESDDETAILLHRALLSDEVSNAGLAHALTVAGYPIGRSAVGDYRRKLRREGV